MKSWQPHQRLALYLLSAIALTCLIAPLFSVGADWFTNRWPALASGRIPFNRVFNRAFMVAAVLLFVFFRRWLIPPGLKELFRANISTASGDLLTGLALALGSTALLVCAMVAADIFTPFLRLELADAMERVATALLAGIFAGTIEEIFFRGILFTGLRAQGSAARAYLIANLFYSLLHFVKPGQHYFVDGLDLTAGFRHLAYIFTPFYDPLPLLPGIFGLFLIGVVLSYAVERTGKLYLAIGLHAGWVIAIKTMRLFGDFTREQLGWQFGSSEPKIVSGVATWAGFLLVGLAVYYLTRKRAARLADRPRATRA